MFSRKGNEFYYHARKTSKKEETGKKLVHSLGLYAGGWDSGVKGALYE